MGWGRDGGHTVGAHRGQQGGSQCPRPCGSEGARRDDRQTNGSSVVVRLELSSPAAECQSSSDHKLNKTCNKT